MPANRDVFLDLVKGILILLVVFGHMLELGEGAVVDVLYHFVYSFHMPLFVFISGYFTRVYQTTRDFFTSNVRILETLIVFQLILCVLRLCMGEPFSLTMLTIPYWALWYLLSLFWWRLLVNFINPKKHNNMLCIFVSLFMCLIAGYIDVTYFVSFQRTFYFFPFFMLGHCLAIDKKDIKNYCMSLKLSMMILITALVGFIGICGVGGVTFKQFLYGAYIYDISLEMFYPMVVRLSIILISYIISLSFLSVCVHIKESQWLKMIGKSTLLFYVYHTLILTVLKKAFFAYDIPNSLFSIVLYTLILVVSLYKFSGNIYLIKLLNPITAKK